MTYLMVNWEKLNLLPNFKMISQVFHSDKPKILNASFIILYRIPSQGKPAEYDYTLLDAKTGAVMIGDENKVNTYKFDMQKNRPLRNFATWAGRPGGPNDGKDFVIKGYGHATVPIEK